MQKRIVNPTRGTDAGNHTHNRELETRMEIDSPSAISRATRQLLVTCPLLRTIYWRSYNDLPGHGLPSWRCARNRQKEYGLLRIRHWGSHICDFLLKHHCPNYVDCSLTSFFSSQNCRLACCRRQLASSCFFAFLPNGQSSAESLYVTHVLPCPCRKYVIIDVTRRIDS